MTTPFIKELFTYHGGYLMYRGTHDLSKKFEEDTPIEKLHPSNVGRYRDTFIARFKYGQRSWKKWVTFICKNFTCEEWVSLSESGMCPTDIIESKGYFDEVTVRVLRGSVNTQKKIIAELQRRLEEAKK
tara:strand:- start:1450 stop:1836 length:387 start_codon:yes stop_codon:yes gene_type:complete